MYSPGCDHVGGVLCIAAYPLVRSYTTTTTSSTAGGPLPLCPTLSQRHIPGGGHTRHTADYQVQIYCSLPALPRVLSSVVNLELYPECGSGLFFMMRIQGKIYI